MKRTLYIANLPADIEESTVREIFAATGEIESIEIEPVPILNGSAACVRFVSEKPATQAKNTLNGHPVGGRRIAVSPFEAGERQRLSEKQRKATDEIAQRLGETSEIPLRQLAAVVMLCGTNFAEALLEETEIVESGEGIMTVESDRRRSKGGVFFYLARHRMSKAIRTIIYNRKGRLPEKPAQDETES